MCLQSNFLGPFLSPMYRFHIFLMFLELSHALYQHDAACRVIARLTKEATAAREALATLKPHSGLPQPAQPTVQQMQVDKEQDDGKNQLKGLLWLKYICIECKETHCLFFPTGMIFLVGRQILMSENIYSKPVFKIFFWC